MIRLIDFHKKKPRNKKAEANVHVQVCNYIDKNYPDVIYTSDQSGLKMSIGLAVAIKTA